jgi:hypothetical protein
MSDHEVFGSATWNGTTARFGYGACPHCEHIWFWVNNGTDSIRGDCPCYCEGDDASRVTITGTTKLLIKIERISGEILNVELTNIVHN